MMSLIYYKRIHLLLFKIAATESNFLRLPSQKLLFYGIYYRIDTLYLKHEHEMKFRFKWIKYKKHLPIKFDKLNATNPPFSTLLVRFRTILVRYHIK